MIVKPRVRFAPSPTGPLHIGGVRTALYNYLLAKQNNGQFILRIEDTDQTRFVPGAEEYIIETFKWLGINFDEGQGVGGDFGPYKQSERKTLYRQYADFLLENDWAYIAFDTPEELDILRKRYEAEKKNFQYDCTTRQGLRNSLTLSREEVEKLKSENVHYVIRFKFPENTEIIVRDLIRGEVKVNSNLLDDKVLFKSDGMPTYHLANVVDDYLMKITHVVRGEEWLPSAPLHVMLYKAFGWENVMPRFAHLPLLLKPDGNGKLSKRDGDRLGFPVFPLEWKDPHSGEISSGYREKGYLPEAVINFLALLGWNPGTEQELFTLDELIKTFSIEKISKSGAKFDLEKALWFNHHYIQEKDTTFLTQNMQEMLASKQLKYEDDYVSKVVTLVKSRVHLLPEFWEQASFFFEKPSYDAEKLKGLVIPEIHIENLISILEKGNSLHDEIMQYITDNALKTGQVMKFLRFCIVGDLKGPDLFEIIGFLGVSEVVERIKECCTK